MYNIAVIGDRDSILGFKTLGLSVHFAYDQDRVRSLITRLAREKTAIIFITEPLAKMVPDMLERFKAQTIPAIIPIPSNKGTTGYGMARLNENVEKAVGVNILINDEEGEM